MAKRASKSTAGLVPVPVPVQDADTSEVRVLDYRNPQAGLGKRILRASFGFIMINYLFYGLVGMCVLVALCSTGPAGILVSAVAVLAYLPSFLKPYQTRSGNVWLAFRDMKPWNWIQEYLQLRIIRTTKLDPAQNYIFGWQPHGIIILSRVAVYGGAFKTLFPGVDMRVLGASPMFYIPGCREICLWLGAIDASKHVAERQLANGLSLFIYPGGSKEIFHTDPKSTVTTLELTHRKGFVRLALKYGTPLVPVFVFGEKWCFNRYVFPEAWRKWCLAVLRIPLLLFWGRFGTLLPLKTTRGLGVVYGAPIPVEKTEAASEEQVDAVLKKYIAAVTALYDNHKATFGYDDKETLLIK